MKEKLMQITIKLPCDSNNNNHSEKISQTEKTENIIIIKRIHFEGWRARSRSDS